MSTSSTEDPLRSRPRARAAAPAGPRRAPARRTAATAPAGARAAEAAHPNAPRMPFVLLVLGLLGGALVTLLMLHAVLAEDTFEISTLQQENRELAQEEQALREMILHAESPDRIAEAAEELGMEPGEAPEFIDLGEGGTGRDAE
ncbi:hypothetical protein [Actinorugispora endophytica]|uniref:Cell division protein FtsL n=1 Tax=Actinorugispora endophytica TaxID=1605990 RepID=A0A4R6UYM2_9ACTN|nr:hypothetical protein [Actinorugispora endophytica]TDQ52594.1 hypothetical protein EV190_106235 [Actinorugispora endophytica]